MGYVLDSCPTLHRCCLSVPLRPAVLAIGLVGVVWAALYVFGFTGTGVNLLEELGVPHDVAAGMRYVHGVAGVLLCAAHVLLLLGAVTGSDALCELYVWLVVALWALLVAAATVLAVAAVLADQFLFACVSLALVLLTVLISFYFVIVVANYRMTLP
ncbi:uncharacterized protein LOC115449058 [Manduca sexta]|uniref:Uncharacterized protein n=1 Tax=Manduca sexta TaxID=7130 RepID=A0A921ZIS8_MANSE|nr:uncharacterized protein LOC115449058 [Manduca sexta]KAG6458772.1 hypothetical protein O3G_MSEX011044 [Manduca sexta]